MVPLFCGLPALVLSLRVRSGRWLGALRPGLGLPLTLLIVAPWFAAITWKSGGAFYGEAVGHDMMSKVQGGSEKHFAPRVPTSSPSSARSGRVRPSRR